MVSWKQDVARRCEDLQGDLLLLEPTAEKAALQRAREAVGRVKRRVEVLVPPSPDGRSRRPDRDVTYRSVHAAEDAVNDATSDLSVLLGRAEEHVRRSLPAEEGALRLHHLRSLPPHRAVGEARSLIRACHARSDEHMATLRSTITMTWWLAAAALVTVLALVLWAVPASEGLIPVADTTLDDRQLQGLVLLFGAIGGLVAAITTFVQQPDLGEARWFDPRLALSALKIISGALFGLLGVLVMGSGPIVEQYGTVAGVVVVATVFGYSQQSLTRVLDQRASASVERAAAEPARGAAPLPGTEPAPAPAEPAPGAAEPLPASGRSRRTVRERLRRGVPRRQRPA